MSSQLNSLAHTSRSLPRRSPASRLLPLALSLSIAGLHLPVTFAAPGERAGDNGAASGEPPLPATKSKASVTLNFVNADIEAVSRAIGAMLDRQILVDPRVKGQVTVTSEKPQPPLEAWRNYLAALRGLGFTVVENAGMLKVVPEAEAKLQAGTVAVGAPQARGDQILTQIFRLNHENPNNLVAVLRPLITANNTINANPGNNTLIITDYADNLQRMGKIIAALDQPAASEVEVIQVKHSMAADLAPMLQRLTDSSGGAMAPGVAAAGSGSTSILVDSRSNSLIIRASNPARMAATKALIEKLDRPTPGGGPAGNIWVVYLKNADAVKLAEVLRAAMASGTVGGGGGASGGSSGMSGASRQAATSGAGMGNASGATSTAATSAVSASAGPSTGGQIQADPSTNSLIISAPEPVYRQMRQVIDQLDTRRAQIYVETMIVKVDAEKAAEFGVQWQGLLGSTKNNTVGYAGTNYGSGGNNILSLTAAQLAGGSATATSGVSLPSTGLNVGILNKINGTFTLGALARFLQTNTGANVLSTPNLVSLDNEEAKIVIGSNVPFTTGSFTNTGTGNGAVNPFQTVERKDVGITLKIKSQIGEGGTVRMTIYQENSSLRSATTQITDKSSIETTVVVDDGQTMVLGGLLKDEYNDGEGAVPLLSSIPVLGNLFRNETRNRTKSNLMLFLRPVVLRTAGAAEALTVDRYDTMRNLQENSQPDWRMLLPINGAPVLPQRPVKTDPAGAVPAAPAAPTAPEAPKEN